MEKSKRVSLGVEKKTKSSKQIKKRLLSNVLDYFKSDSYMFAPLISPSPSGTKFKEPIKEKKKRVLKMAGKYMKSDTYMYSPLLSSHLLPSPPSAPFYSEQTQCFRKTTVEFATSTESENAVSNKQPCEDAGLSIVDNQKLGQGETVKHMVYQRYCSTPVPGKAMADVQPKKVLVE